MPPEEMWSGFFDPNTVLKKLGLTSNCRDILEFGCGYGTFTIPAARRVAGTVYALDIDPDMAWVTAARAAQAPAPNIVVERRDFVTAGSGRADGSAALAILFNILHLEDPVDLLREARRILGPEGAAAVIHWRGDIDTPRGPPLHIRPPPEQCAAWAEQAGFAAHIVRNLPDSPWHWGMLLHPAVILES